MRYCDTSFLVPLVRNEPTSTEIRRFVAGLPGGELAISHLVRVEFSSVMARDVRMGLVTISMAMEASTSFEAILTKVFEIHLPSATDFDLACEFISNHETGLRTADALHLATARNNRCEAIYSLDKTLLRAGKMLGLPVSTGISLAGYDM